VITDSHSHLYWQSFADDLDAVLERARAAEVTRMIVVGTSVETSRAAFALAAEQLEVYPTAGIHPNDTEGTGEEERAVIEELARRPECVGIGESGLDFFRDHASRRAQFDSFHWHLDLARRLDKPVVIHCRDAVEETARTIAEYPGVRGVLHCYTYGAGELPAFLEAGLCISFSGVVTYPKNDDNRAAAREVPADRLLVETDCPFLAPQGNRGKRNEPALVRTVLEKVAEVRGEDVETLARQTSDNAARLFGLAPLGKG